MRSRVVLGLAALATAGAAVVLPAEASTSTDIPAGNGGAINFGACPDDLAQRFPHLTCGRLDVPLDYSRPAGPKVSLLISKAAATDPAKRRGALFVNPGGPGGSGAAYAGSLTTKNASGYTRLPADVLAAYDVIGMDPRGTSRSGAVSCVAPDYFKPPQLDPDSRATRTTLWGLWNGFADGCGTKSGDLIPYVGTENAARDLDQIRAALGEEKFNYYGVSYGTWLGAVYGKLFPHRVDRMVLDGNINPDPEQLWYRAALAQAPALQTRLGVFLRWLARYDSVFGMGDTEAETRAAWNKVLSEFRAQPHGTAGAQELLGTAYGVLFGESGWIPFAQVLSDYVVRGDDTGLVEFVTPSTEPADEEFNAIFNAVICVDSPAPASKRTWERDTDAAARTSQFAWYTIWWNGSACQDWPVPAMQRTRITGKNLPGILMFNSTGDPATPYAGALRMHKALPTSVLVTEKDAGKHGVFASAQAQANAQANAIGARYLVDGKLPAHDVTVPGHPLPVPTASVTRTTVQKRELPIMG